MILTRDAIIGFIVLVLVIGGIVWYALSQPPAAPAGTEAPVGSALGPQTITDHGQYYDIDAQYPGSTALKDLPDSADVDAVALMKQWETDTIATFKSDSGLDHLTPEDIQMQGLDQGRKYTLSITYETHSSPRTASYVYTIYQDTLGAHPNGFYKTFAFDTQTGANLSLKSLFTPGFDYLGYLSKNTRANLPAMIASRENIPVSEVDMDMLNADQPVEASFQDFYLDDGDFVLLFPPYAIGPYVLGSTEFHLPLKDFPGLKDEYR